MENLQFTFDQRLDSTLLHDLYEGDLDHAIVVFDQFLDMAPALMKDITESYSAGVVEIFRQKVHKIKPVFSFVGLNDLTAQAETLENRCKEIFIIDEIGQMFENLQGAYREGFTIIEQETKRLKEHLN